MRKISVLIKRPGEVPRHVNISNTLENLQRNIGGYIECVTLASDLVIICDEEGLLKGLPFNADICGYKLHGTIILCGVDGDQFADLPASWDDMKRLFPQLWEVS